MSSIPKIATQEMSDTDLDNVSGGLGGGAFATGGIDGAGAWASGGVDGLVPAGFTLSTQGLSAQGAGGVDISGITGLASTLAL
jgi:hypothetical protein